MPVAAALVAAAELTGSDKAPGGHAAIGLCNCGGDGPVAGMRGRGLLAQVVPFRDPVEAFQAVSGLAQVLGGESGRGVGLDGEGLIVLIRFRVVGLLKKRFCLFAVGRCGSAGKGVDAAAE